jgi:hypothetical protein
MIARRGAGRDYDRLALRDQLASAFLILARAKQQVA